LISDAVDAGDENMTVRDANVLDEGTKPKTVEVDRMDNNGRDKRVTSIFQSDFLIISYNLLAFAIFDIFSHLATPHSCLFTYVKVSMTSDKLLWGGNPELQLQHAYNLHIVGTPPRPSFVPFHCVVRHTFVFRMLRFAIFSFILALIAVLQCGAAEHFRLSKHGVGKIRLSHRILELRGGKARPINNKTNKQKVNASKKNEKKKRFPTTSNVPAEAHHREAMSASTAVFNVLADLCPHGMLPIGMQSNSFLWYRA
jgi:hypothetical protein